LSQAWYQKKTKNQDGFTLIELMVVVGIMVLMSVLVMPSVSSYFQLSLNSATRDLATTVKEAYNSAVITGKVYRLVYDLKEHSFWVESGPANALLDTKETKEKEERRRKIMNATASSDNEFKMDKTVTRKKIKLPRGVEYEDIITQQSKEAIVKGIAYTHFFPHGLTEQTIIHLKDQSTHHASLVITPLIGMTDVYDRYVNSNEVFETK
jgi:prepilin-type N-terminal cleavage/methylation domain-containing protein